MIACVDGMAVFVIGILFILQEYFMDFVDENTP